MDGLALGGKARGGEADGVAGENKLVVQLLLAPQAILLIYVSHEAVASTQLLVLGPLLTLSHEAHLRKAFIVFYGFDRRQGLPGYLELQDGSELRKDRKYVLLDQILRNLSDEELVTLFGVPLALLGVIRGRSVDLGGLVVVIGAHPPVLILYDSGADMILIRELWLWSVRLYECMNV